MTMGGIAKRYGATEPLILALEAGTDILLMPRDVTTAIQTVLDAVISGRLTEKRIDESVRRVLAYKARAGLIDGRMVDVSAVDRIVNVPANQKVADDVAERSITLGLDRQNLVPFSGVARKRLLSITYAGASDLIAGSAFNSAMRARFPGIETLRVDERTTPAEYSSLRTRADSADVVLVSAYVSPEAYKGTVAADVSFAQVIDSLAKGNKPVVLISFGSPYLITSFPSASTYIFAWGGAPVSQRAAALALLGERAITGKLPVSIPPLLKFGDGIIRDALPSAAKETPTGTRR
jgi:beta-N-acetylhexosaminidase